jgi:hypothetical protein
MPLAAPVMMAVLFIRAFIGPEVSSHGTIEATATAMHEG